MPAPGTTRAVSPRDREIGQLIRAQRVGLKMSQTDLANAIGVTFQQVQKYERGVNRIGASRLERIAATLGVEPGFFFGGNGSPGAGGDLQAAAALLQTAQAHRMLTAFNKVRSRDVREALVTMCEQFGARGG